MSAGPFTSMRRPDPGGPGNDQRVRLVAPRRPSARAPALLDPVQSALVSRRRGSGPVVLLGAPGTGKTTALIEAVVARVERDGVPPDGVLVLAASRTAAAALRTRICARLGRTVREPLARTPHSYAFGLLRRARVLDGDPPPRLISGPEQDRVLAELMAGHEAGLVEAPPWPATIGPELRELRGFRDELRDLLMRAVERGIGPDELADLGRRHDRPDWVAVAHVLAEYLDVTALATPGAYDPAGIVDAAAELLASDEDLLAAEQDTWRFVAVDDVQEATAATHRLLDQLGGGGRDLLLVGDPDAATQTFRGARPQLLAEAPSRWPTYGGAPADVLVLPTAHRQTPRLREVTVRVAERIGSAGVVAHRRAAGADDVTATLLDPALLDPDPPEPDPPEPDPPEPEWAPPAWSEEDWPALDRAEPDRVEPDWPEPDWTEPDWTEPDGPEPAWPEPSAPEPGGTKPGGTKPGGTKPGGPEPGAPAASLDRSPRGLALPDRPAPGPSGPPGPGPDRSGEGSVEVHLLASAAQEAAFVAGRLRRLHLTERLPWSAMAVVVRSARGTDPLRRALSAAGVPVAVPPTEVSVRDEAAVVPLRLALRVALDPDALTADIAVELLTGPLGGVDAVGLRRLRQGLRAIELADGGGRGSDALLVAALTEPGTFVLLDPGIARGALRVAAVVEAGRRAAAEPGATAETVLWELWQAGGLADGWRRTALAGGTAGIRADRDLDAVMTLFEAAERYTDRMPLAGPAGFLAHLEGQDLPADTLAERAPDDEAVALVTAQGAAGREWDVVAVAGVQEGTWPDLRLRSSLLGAQALADLVDGRTDSARARGAAEVTANRRAVLDDELRTFHVAVSRARRHLLVTAVRSEDELPSAFLDLVVPPPDDDDGRALTEVPRSMTLPALVAELRAVLLAATAAAGDEDADSDGEGGNDRDGGDDGDDGGDGGGGVGGPGGPGGGPGGGGPGGGAGQARPRTAAHRQAEAAARQLAALARAGVPGADPDDWYALPDLTGTGPLRPDGETVSVSPSKVEQFHRCALRWLLDASGGTTPTAVAQALGTLVHEVAQEVPDGDLPHLLDLLETRIGRLGLPDSWVGDRERERARTMVRKFADYVAAHGSKRELVGVEETVRVLVGRAEIRGQVDRLERDADGRLVVVDLKTGRSSPPAAELARQAQLGVYQLAVEEGGFSALVPGAREAGGAALVQLGTPTKGVGVQGQPPLAEDDDPGWARQLVRTAADGMAGETFPAAANPHCRVCAVKRSCPLQPEGRQVGE